MAQPPFRISWMKISHYCKEEWTSCAGGCKIWWLEILRCKVETMLCSVQGDFGLSPVWHCCTVLDANRKVKTGFTCTQKVQIRLQPQLTGAESCSIRKVQIVQQVVIFTRSILDASSWLAVVNSSTAVKTVCISCNEKCKLCSNNMCRSYCSVNWGSTGSTILAWRRPKPTVAL